TTCPFYLINIEKNQVLSKKGDAIPNKTETRHFYAEHKMSQLPSQELKKTHRLLKKKKHLSRAQHRVLRL
ncbi:MAG: hypothetical protein IJ846_07405, partial [Alphaproteobacteria bacterium]|nr:hypothetical protein [Alphaproteobacteria bacterium]